VRGGGWTGAEAGDGDLRAEDLEEDGAGPVRERPAGEVLVEEVPAGEVPVLERAEESEGT
jgi:hypothetical protein